MSGALPLVTLAVPVRNGAAMLHAALDSLVAQDYPNIEIIISDNGSTDATADIVRDYQSRHPHIRLIQQSQTLTAIDNFLFLLCEAKGEFFSWCAHDDTRSPDFVSGLLTAFADPQTVLAFGDLYIWDGQSPPRQRAGYDFANAGLARWQRLRKAALMQCYHIYGLWRTEALRRIPYVYTHWWSDMPIMLASAVEGNFRHQPGLAFIYYEVIKSRAARAAYQDNLNRPSRFKNFSALFKAAFLTVTRVAGPFVGALAVLFLVEKFGREAVRVMTSGRGEGA